MPGKAYNLDKENCDLFRWCPPQYVVRPPVTEHVPYSKLLCIKMARASGGSK